jgi:hypothetical protein
MAQGESTETNVTMVEALLLLAIGYFTKHGGGLKVLQLVAMGMKHALIVSHNYYSQTAGADKMAHYVSSFVWRRILNQVPGRWTRWSDGIEYFGRYV